MRPIFDKEDRFLIRCHVARAHVIVTLPVPNLSHWDRERSKSDLSQSHPVPPNLKNPLSQSHPVPPNLKTPLSQSCHETLRRVGLLESRL